MKCKNCGEEYKNKRICLKCNHITTNSWCGDCSQVTASNLCCTNPEPDPIDDREGLLREMNKIFRGR